MFCPECGSEVKDGARFCPKCGHAMARANTGGASNTPTTNQPPAARPASQPMTPETTLGTPRHSHKLAILATVAVVAVAAAGWFVWVTFLSPYPIDQEHFPDASFRSYVESTFDTNHDGSLSRDEARAVTSLGTWSDASADYVDTIEGLNISSLGGVEYFPELTSIVVSDNPLSSMDLSHNTKLRYVVAECDPLTSLDVTGCSELEEVWVEPTTDVTGLSDKMDRHELGGDSTETRTSTSSTSSSSATSYGNEITRAYDLAGNLLTESNSPTGSNTTSSSWSYSYEEDLIDEATYKTTSGSWSGSLVYTVEHDATGGISKFSGQSAKGDTGSATIVNADSTHPSSASIVGSDGDEAFTFTYSYDDANRLAQEKITRGSSIFTFDITYDDSGHVSKIVEVDGALSSDSTTKAHTYEYDGAGRMTTSTSSSDDSAGAYSLSTTYTYDDKGNVSQEASTNSGSKSSEINHSYTYDDAGTITNDTVKTMYYDTKTGKTTSSSTEHLTYETHVLYKTGGISEESSTIEQGGTLGFGVSGSLVYILTPKVLSDQGIYLSLQ